MNQVLHVYKLSPFCVNYLLGFLPFILHCVVEIEVEQEVCSQSSFSLSFTTGRSEHQPSPAPLLPPPKKKELSSKAHTMSFLFVSSVPVAWRPLYLRPFFTTNKPSTGTHASRGSSHTPRRPRCTFYASAAAGNSGGDNHKNAFGNNNNNKDKDRGSGSGGSTMDWQEELRMLLDPSLNASAKQVLIQDFAKRLPEVIKSPCVARGFEDVFRQLTDDVIPDLVTNGPKYVSRAMESAASSTTTVNPRESSSSSSSSSDSSSSFTPPPMNMNMEEVSREVRNIFNRTPEGLFTPAYDVLTKTDTYDIRRYGTVIIAETDMKPDDVSEGESALAMGRSFNTLAGYLFGGNSSKTSMKMTTPVMLSKTSSSSTATRQEGDEQQKADSMSFIIGEYASVDDVPKTVDDRVTLREQPGTTYAAVEFSGFVTVGEAKRQRQRLLTALRKDGVQVTALGEREYKCMVYNGPSTLPNLRRNEMLIEVEYGGVVEEEEVD